MSRQALGMDLHRRFSKVSLMEQADLTKPDQLRVVRRARLNHDDRPAMRAWLAELPPGTPVAMEGSFGWPWVADLLAELGLDADRLAQFWLKGTFPQSYLSTPAVRQIRERVRFRMTLAALRTQLKNRMHAILHRQGVQHDFSDLFGQRGRAFLAQLELPAGTRYALDHWLQLLDAVLAQLADVEQWMQANLETDPVVQILQTIPGIGLILAHAIRSEVGELTPRFVNRQKFTRYVGLAPLADDSADRHGRRHIRSSCNHALRWAFIEAAAACVHAKQCPAKLRRLHDRLSRHAGAAQARAAVAARRARTEWLVGSNTVHGGDKPEPSRNKVNPQGSGGKGPSGPKFPPPDPQPPSPLLCVPAEARKQKNTKTNNLTTPSVSEIGWDKVAQAARWVHTNRENLK